MKHQQIMELKNEIEELKNTICFLRQQYDSLTIESVEEKRRYEKHMELIIKENKKLLLKSRIVDKLPFCPNHRDKVAGKSCRECEIENLKRKLEERTFALHTAIGMAQESILPTPTHYKKWRVLLGWTQWAPFGDYDE